MSGVDRVLETRFSSHCGESSHCTARARWQLLKQPSAGRGIKERLGHGRESRMGGDERGQDAGPLVHAVRVRDVLQLDGLSALLGALRTWLICR